MAGAVTTSESRPPGAAGRPFAVVAGYGVPGRNCAEWLTRHGWDFAVIERNEEIVGRCGKSGVPIVAGDARDEATLRGAGLDRAAVVVVTIPVETVVLEVVTAARRVNPSVRILARLSYISSGFEAVRLGADDAVVAEELAAREFVRLLDGGRSAFRATGQTRPPVTAVEQVSP